ncbi:MAG: hypothetical protein Q8N04_19320 [Nitrospira sp.]|nr:hypothetical protein [Nitrospira sp.]
MKGHIVLRVLKNRIAYEANVRYKGKTIYIGRFCEEQDAKKGQREAYKLLKQGQRPSPPPVPRMQVGDEGVTSRSLIDGTIVYDINVTVKRKRDSVQSFLTKVEAIAARTAWLEHINAGDLTFRPTTQPLPKHKPLGAELRMDPSPPADILFVDYAYRWYQARKELWAAWTLYEYRSAVRRFLNPVLETVPVIAVSEGHLKTLDAMLASHKVTQKRRTKIRRALAKILHSTIVDGLRTSHPASYAWCRTGQVTQP